MKLNKITGKGRTGSFHVAHSEILIVNWAHSSKADFYSFDKTKILKKIDKDYFALSMIGTKHKIIENQLPSSIENYSITKDKKGSTYYCSYQDGIIYGFDKYGTKFFEWWAAEIGEGHPIYDIKFQEPCYLWLAFPTGQTVTQISIPKQKEIFKIGEYSWEDNSEPLSYPESIFVKGDFLFIPNMGNNRLFKFNIKTKELKLIKTFDRKIWQYSETEIGRFITTDTGIYEIEEEKCTDYNVKAKVQ